MYHVGVNLGLESETAVNISVSVKIWKNITCAKKNYIWNPARCSCENDKYLASATAQKKYSFPLRMYPVNATKAAVSCGFCPIYWRSPK